MKLILAILLFVSASLYADERADYIAKLPKADIIKTIEHLQKLTKEAQATSAAAMAQNEFVTGQLVDLQRINESTRRLAAQDAVEKENLRVWGEEQATIATKAIKDRDQARELAAHRGFLLGLICAVAGMLAGVSLMRLLPPPYNLLAPLVFAGGGFAFGRWLL